MKLLQLYKPYYSDYEKSHIIKALDSRWLSKGRISEQFEKKLIKFIKSNYLITANSCTSGINAVLNSFNLKRGDEVITTLLTYISTIHSLYNLGLKIKFVDINNDDLSINLIELQKNITTYNSKMNKSQKLNEAAFSRIQGTIARQQAKMQQFQLAASFGSSLLTSGQKTT